MQHQLPSSANSESLASLNMEKDKVLDLKIERSLRETFVAVLTHDLKTPLSVMMGAAELIQRNGDTSEKSKTLAGMIVNQARRSEKMINNLLDANRISSGQKLAIEMEIIDLNKLVHDTLAEMKMIHANEFIVEEDHTIQLSCDSNSIRRILENLCGNAVKYGFKETPITITLKESEQDIQIAVNNKGVVIPESDQPFLFDQFRRTRTAERSANEGWGIGLTLVRGMAEAHGGRVTVKSESVAGTTFTVILPKKLI